jgi:hypothetical protein
MTRKSVKRFGQIIRKPSAPIPELRNLESECVEQAERASRACGGQPVRPFAPDIFLTFLTIGSHRPEEPARTAKFDDGTTPVVDGECR